MNGLLFRVIGASDQWPGLYVGESHRPPLFFQERKFSGSIIAGDRQMVSRRLEILSDGDDVAVDGSQIAHDFTGLVQRLTHAQDQAGLGRHSLLLGSPE